VPVRIGVPYPNFDVQQPTTGSLSLTVSCEFAAVVAVAVAVATEHGKWEDKGEATIIPRYHYYYILP